MSKQLYEEALADVKKVKETAEDNAKRAIIDAVTPRIKDLIERELLREHGDFDDDDDDMSQDVASAPGSPDVPGELMTDRSATHVGTVPLTPVMGTGDSDVAAAAISMPDEEGKVTLDLDALVVEPACAPAVQPTGVAVGEPMFGEPLPPADEYEISMESVNALKPMIRATKKISDKQFEAGLANLGETVNSFRTASPIIRESSGYQAKIVQMISRVENMYEYVQESVKSTSKKNSYETKLETYFQDLNKLTERKMSKKSLKQLMNEADVTLKLTGLPDETDLEAVGVDLITGEEDEEGGDMPDLGGEGGDEGGDELDLDDLGGEEETQMEQRKLSDDTVVEIDEGMLRREISRMKKLREETKPASWGHGVGSKEMDDFGGGKDDGEAFLDGEVTTEAQDDDLEEGQDELDEVDADLTMDEADDDDLDEAQDQDDDDLDEAQDDDLDEVDQITNEQDQLDQLGNRRKRDTYGDAADSHVTTTWDKRVESASRRLSFEKRLQERAKSRAASLKKEAVQAKAKKLLKKEAFLKGEYAKVATRFNESVARAKKISKLMAEAMKSRKGASLNASTERPAGNSADKNLRAKLAETNLFNAKLLYTNRLLQNEVLSKKQKAEIIERLDDAKSIREVKLVYESLSRTLAGTSKPIREGADRKVLGSGSRATQPGSTTLNEGFETDRWQKLAGINK
jgi:hypothetical protein